MTATHNRAYVKGGNGLDDAMLNAPCAPFTESKFLSLTAMKKNYKRLSILLGISLLGGCASMNKSECLNADWKMIGMEDGSRGRLVSYIGKHRSACAKYNITPDLTAYETGHADGVKQYCTHANGYQVGRNGAKYNGVCPGELEATFLNGYNAGHEHYIIQSHINELERSIDSVHAQIKELKDKVDEREKQLISGSMSIEERAALLIKIEKNQKKIGRLQAKLLEYEKEKTVTEEELKEHSSKFSY